ncbi:YdeI/OmpD-associated family protein [Enterococcus olivae]
MTQGLAKKLRLTMEEPIVVLHRPSMDYFSGFNISEQQPTEPVATIILFVKDLEEMKEEIQKIITAELLEMNGRLLVCYPKKGNKKWSTFIHRDEIFPALQVDQDGFIAGTDYKFNQMVKLDDTYTILGIKRTVQKKSVKPSQSVADYIQFLPTLEKRLAAEPKAQKFFQHLTPGYQRNWARYVYSAKREATQDKRFHEMVQLLNQGIKSKDLA